MRPGPGIQGAQNGIPNTGLLIPKTSPEILVSPKNVPFTLIELRP